MDDSRLDALLSDLAARDPRVRDERALGEVLDAITSDDLTADQRATVGQRMLDHLQHKEIQARTFAPLVLGVLTEHGDWDDAWFDRTREWYLSEDDVRGHDAERGWLHAIAHGADFFGTVAHVGSRPAADSIDVLTERMLLATDAVWRDQEDVRVAYALALCLIREPASTGWLDPLAERLAGGSGPPPAWATNTTRTLQALALGLEQQILFNGEPVTMPDLRATRAAVLEVVQATQPWFWRTATA